MRTPTGLSAGKACRTASKTSRGKAMRFSRLPPYLSARLLLMGDRTVDGVHLDGVKADTGRPERGHGKRLPDACALLPAQLSRSPVTAHGPGMAIVVQQSM